MATTTTNFGWDIPQSTDLVKDGATAIAALGQDIDTALVDLKGGTTGQVLSKASGTDLDFSWASGGGKVVQIVFDEHTESKSSATNTYIDTGLTATITPTSASNEIIVMVSHNGCFKNTNNTAVQMRLMRGATQIAQMSDTGGFTNSSVHNYFGNISLDYKDAPATTSATTYKTQFRSEGNNANAGVGANTSLGTMILIEVTP
jgi:hypothetical protein